jgi:hypothetical protein
LVALSPAAEEEYENPNDNRNNASSNCSSNNCAVTRAALWIRRWVRRWTRRYGWQICIELPRRKIQISCCKIACLTAGRTIYTCRRFTAPIDTRLERFEYIILIPNLPPECWCPKDIATGGKTAASSTGRVCEFAILGRIVCSRSNVA